MCLVFCRISVSEQAVHPERSPRDHVESSSQVWLLKFPDSHRPVPPTNVSHSSVGTGPSSVID